jgi:hypothetical protein
MQVTRSKRPAGGSVTEPTRQYGCMSGRTCAIA